MGKQALSMEKEVRGMKWTPSYNGGKDKTFVKTPAFDSSFIARDPDKEIQCPEEKPSKGGR